MMTTYRIGEIAKLAGINASTIRYYERVGLLPEPQRENGIRCYDATVLERLAVIQLAKTMGLSLEEINTFLNGHTHSNKPQALWNAIAPQKLEQIDEQIRSLNVQRLMWKQSQDCSCETLYDCAVMTNS